jgi:hypothetical protein
MKYTAEEVREWAAFAQAQGKLYASMKGAHEPWEKLEAMLTELAERIRADEGAVVVAHRFIGPDGAPVTEWDDGLPDNRKTFPDLCPPVASVQYAYDRPPAQAAHVDRIDKRRFAKAPCYLCGYNGPGYYQPNTHPCAAKYHVEDAEPVAQEGEE